MDLPLQRRRKSRSKTPPLRPTASTKTPGSPVFENQAARSSERQRAAALQSRGASSGGGGRGGGTLAEGLMFSHKPNPIFDTNDTNSSRGSDYEVINLTGIKNGSGSSPENTPVRICFSELEYEAGSCNPPFPLLSLAREMFRSIASIIFGQLNTNSCSNEQSQSMIVPYIVPAVQHKLLTLSLVW